MIENNEMDQVVNILHYCNCTVTSSHKKHHNHNEKMWNITKLVYLLIIVVNNTIKIQNCN